MALILLEQTLSSLSRQRNEVLSHPLSKAIAEVFKRMATGPDGLGIEPAYRSWKYLLRGGGAWGRSRKRYDSIESRHYRHDPFSSTIGHDPSTAFPFTRIIYSTVMNEAPRTHATE